MVKVERNVKVKYMQQWDATKQCNYVILNKIGPKINKTEMN